MTGATQDGTSTQQNRHSFKFIKIGGDSVGKKIPNQHSIPG